jgi:hypothetical protein
MEPHVAKVPGITTFEVMTCLALMWFADQAVEWAVLEVGLGGRLDATNALVPEVAVITSISYDHMAILGDTLAEIAAEKAGIIKPGVPVVSAPQTREALEVIEEVCREKGAPLTVVDQSWTWEVHPNPERLDGQTFAIRRGQEVWEDLWLPLLGEHQVINATTAVAVMAQLRQSGVRVRFGQEAGEGIAILLSVPTLGPGVRSLGRSRYPGTAGHVAVGGQCGDCHPFAAPPGRRSGLAPRTGGGARLPLSGDGRGGRSLGRGFRSCQPRGSGVCHRLGVRGG